MKLNPNMRFLNMLGIATKAGKVVSGEFSTEKAIKEGRAFLVIVASDASHNTQKLFTDKCSFYKVPVAIGKISRASIAITEEGLAHAIAKYFDGNNMEVD